MDCYIRHVVLHYSSTEYIIEGNDTAKEGGDVHFLVLLVIFGIFFSFNFFFCFCALFESFLFLYFLYFLLFFELFCVCWGRYKMLVAI